MTRPRLLRTRLLPLFVMAVSLSAGGSLAAAEAPLPSDTNDRTPSRIAFREGDRELRLGGETLPTRIVGTYREGRVGLRFSSLKTETGIRLRLRTLDGRDLYLLEQNDAEVRTSVLGGSYVSRFDRAFESLLREELQSDSKAFLSRLGRTSTGDAKAISELLLLPELALLPRLALVLGEDLGLNGVEYPAALPIFLFAKSMNALAERPVEPRFRDFGPRFWACDEYPNQGNDCFGMCGRGCSCWWFVCQDCCYHSGCAEHDRFCRMGWEGSYYCYLEFWTPFNAGGGCDS